jgi:hypothetical protein
MEEELFKWEEDVKGQRDSFYELNYYTTVQLLTLRRELGKLKHSSKNVSISPEVLVLLQSISSQVSDSHVIGAVKKVLVEAEREPSVEIPDSPDKVKVGNVAEVLSEDEDPLKPKDSDTKQSPVFLEDELSEELRGYITTISSRFNWPRQLMLKAIEVLGKDSTQIDYERWCANNEDNYSFKGQEASSDEEESDADSGSDDKDQELPGIYTSELIYGRMREVMNQQCVHA